MRPNANFSPSTVLNDELPFRNHTNWNRQEPVCNKSQSGPAVHKLFMRWTLILNSGGSDELREITPNED
jgi:hypothetical protein